MYDFFTSPTSTIATAQEDLSAPRMTRTASSSSTSSTTSSASLYLSSPFVSATRPSSSASFSSSYWSSPSTSTASSPSTSYVTATGSTSRPSHHRHMSNGTSYLPTPYRSSLMHSSSASSPSPRVRQQQEASSYISDDDLLALDFEPLPPPSQINTHMTTEEQVAAVRDQVERERKEWGLRSQQVAGAGAFGLPVEKKRTLRWAPETQTRRSARRW